MEATPMSEPRARRWSAISFAVTEQPRSASDSTTAERGALKRQPSRSSVACACPTQFTRSRIGSAPMADVFRTPDERFEGLPGYDFAPHWHEAGGLRLHYVDEGPDYPGFGRSDKPTERGWYTYDRHVEHMSDLLGALDLREVTVVVQDWGGPIGLRWAVENADRVARLVILNTRLFTGRVS